MFKNHKVMLYNHSMKKVLFGLIITLISLITTPTYASVDNFYFSDFTADYYLSRDEDGISRLRVKESVMAVFPDYKQNKGICKQISFTNQDGKNITLSSLTNSDLKLTRNGYPENIYSIEKIDNFYEVCTGTDEYLLGVQVYEFEYEFTKVVTEFNVDGREYQELYWDTIGTGVKQRTNHVTARLHFEDGDVFAGKSWCYVGKYGENGADRCVVTEISDGVEFSTRNLSAYENLTFDVELKPDSFVVPSPEKNYTYVLLTILLSIICAFWIGFGVRKYIKSRDKAIYYKNIFVKPEYQPHKEYSLAEMAEVYLGKKKDVKVALLLEMIVKRKVELQRSENKKWNIIVKSLDGVRKESIDLLTILNNGVSPSDGSVIELKRRSASASLIKIKKAMTSRILDDLKNDGLVDAKYQVGGTAGRDSLGGVISAVIAASIVLVPVVIMFGTMLFSFIKQVFHLDATYGQEMIFGREFYLVALVEMAIAVIVRTFFGTMANRFQNYTNKGLEASRYMEGLKLYIEMAEKDRLKVLQSVKGADTSAEGIVKLYEKLLPYAAVFGLEKSWMQEMKEYCEVQDIVEPDYLLNGFTISELSKVTTLASSYANSATVMSSSGGGSSSGFSGGGGGGFSGGGGGGGGFSGR